MHWSWPNVFLFDAGTGAAVSDAPRLDEADGHALLCRTCGHPVAKNQDRIAMNGKHLHTVFNPAGILFEVGCFALAPGCRFEGEFTPEFTWFPGYPWRFAFCRQCGAHLGWDYRNDTGGFVGLIMAELRES